MTEMVRKITLSRAVRIMQNLFPEEYNFYPRSWILPDEFQLFVAQVRMVKDGDPSWKPTFIVKPDSGCQGDGIYLIKDPSDIRLAGTLQSRPAVVQEYICKPLLIDKLKFDIRLYVLLKSLEPLEIYIAKDGLSRFCTEPYQEPHPRNLHHIFMHLTNYSLNIHSGNFVHSDSTSTGSKRTFSSILCRLSSKGVDIKKVWSDIISLVIKTVIALTPELRVFYQSDIPAGRPGPTCFQILGFDILLMKNLKPILLEVNANPSMRIEHEQELSPGVFENVPSLVDEEVKVAVIRDTLRLMDPFKKKRENQNCKLSSGSLSMAAVDILYIDITRRWNSMTVVHQDSGSFFGLMAGQRQDLQACGVQPNRCQPGSRGSRGNSCGRGDVGSSTLPFIEEASFELLQHHSGPTYRETSADWYIKAWCTVESRARRAASGDDGPGRNLPGNLPSRLACLSVPPHRLCPHPLPLGAGVWEQLHLPLL
ncbi:tubulin polyglutamylase TTLL11 isoform X12 [Physeter macrocephalus]|uniref:Tubulin polyglutamylase TTLL11 n=1 Tax=Physeter macrocephalus TaxID=9755 RepID=A0A455BK62_PHYMC|nr:tubulin polyglutamylase TTLL11 isoform X12 [Physeter catodon]|eukprot:XP_028349365.1 tubulin polyglutamylase TTLL11 isoform X8 [Physeter catodon]